MISKLKWKNHEVLGNLELDFKKSDGSIYPNIVIAGENGTGKTTILQNLATFLNLGSIMPFEYIEYFIEGELYQIYYDNENDGEMGFHDRKKMSDGSIVKVRSNSNNNRSRIDEDRADIRKYGVAFSSARSGFKTSQIKGATTQQLDGNKYEVDDKEDFTSIKQLLVDLDVQDNAELRATLDQYGELRKAGFSNYKDKTRMNRFTAAFNAFFESIKFKGIDNNSANEKRVLFSKYGKDISIDNLSTGEKQIVFRGTQLLRNLNALKGGEILIDEPELSMHPRWQAKILDFYLNLFETHDVQTIFTTHSEYVLKSAINKRKDTLVITITNENGIIKANKVMAPNVLPVVTFAETNYLAFNIATIDYHIELYGYLQQKNNNCSVKECDKIISQSSYYDSSLHRKPSNGLGSTTYETLCTYIRNAIDHPDNGNTFSDEELEESIKLLINLCK